MKTLLIGFPFHVFGTSVGATGTGAGIAAVAEQVYVGANVAFTIDNTTGDKVFVLMRENGMRIAANQRIEVEEFVEYMGGFAMLNVATVVKRIRADAFETIGVTAINIVLKPGETYTVRVWNRAPAAAANILATFSGFLVEEVIFNKFMSDQKKELYGEN